MHIYLLIIILRFKFEGYRRSVFECFKYTYLAHYGFKS